MTDEKKLEFLEADLAAYRANFGAVEGLPGGKALVKLLYRIFAAKEKEPDFPADLRVSEEILILSERYPNPRALYRSGFVHRRVKLYQERGVQVSVFCMDPLNYPERYEFDGVTVTAGGRAELYEFLKQNPQIQTVGIHFFNQMMWDVLREFRGLHLISWSHGSDILPWHRRPFLYPTEAEKAFGRAAAQKLSAFWGEIFGKADAGETDADFIYVSEHLREQVREDYHLERYPGLKTHIIHNGIDREIFRYEEKGAQQRKKLLSVRPYDSSKYANDLTTAAILELSKEPFFKELEILIAGDGALFQKLTAPLRKFPNVQIHRGFYRQTELAELYREYGVLLTPTRQDTQGVSRDEGMSCGMVPVTSRCSCVPEFCDDSCGILAEPENPKALAEGIRRLYEEPGLFEAMSKAAGRRAGELCPAYTIEKELALLTRKKSG